MNRSVTIKFKALSEIVVGEKAVKQIAYLLQTPTLRRSCTDAQRARTVAVALASGGHAPADGVIAEANLSSRALVIADAAVAAFHAAHGAVPAGHPDRGPYIATKTIRSFRAARVFAGLAIMARQHAAPRHDAGALFAFGAMVPAALAGEVAGIPARASDGGKARRLRAQGERLSRPI